METSFIQIREFKPSKLKIAFPKKLRINSKIIPSVFVYDVFEMFKTFVKLHLILRMIKNVLRIVSNYFSTVIGCPYEYTRMFYEWNRIVSINEGCSIE